MPRTINKLTLENKPVSYDYIKVAKLTNIAQLIDKTTNLTTLMPQPFNSVISQPHVLQLSHEVYKLTSNSSVFEKYFETFISLTNGPLFNDAIDQFSTKASEILIALTRFGVIHVDTALPVYKAIQTSHEIIISPSLITTADVTMYLDKQEDDTDWSRDTMKTGADYENILDITNTLKYLFGIVDSVVPEQFDPLFDVSLKNQQILDLADSLYNSSLFEELHVADVMQQFNYEYINKILENNEVIKITNYVNILSKLPSFVVETLVGMNKQDILLAKSVLNALTAYESTEMLTLDDVISYYEKKDLAKSTSDIVAQKNLIADKMDHAEELPKEYPDPIINADGTVEQPETDTYYSSYDVLFD